MLNYSIINKLKNFSFVFLVDIKDFFEKGVFFAYYRRYKAVFLQKAICNKSN